MSSDFGSKIRDIREAEELGRVEFCNKTGLIKGTLIHVEAGRNQPRSALVESVCKAFPKYAYWLMTGLVDEKGGHISPEIEVSRRNLAKGASA